MAVKLKPLNEQTIVLTGATSGIGLVTARKAAERGARLVLAARSEDSLQQLTHEITDGGGSAVYVVADVGNRGDVQTIARTATDTFGGCDTWINDAGVSIYGEIETTPVEEMRRLFDTNFWGVVYGSLEAVTLMRERGGALINIGSVLSERSVLLQGAYSASKHAVKGFTDALRMELEASGAPISVTLIKPGAIDTPYPRHAKNYMDAEAQLPPPVYAPDLVAEAILHCAEHPRRAVTVGGGGKAFEVMEQYAPGMTDKVMALMFGKMQQADSPPRPREQHGLDKPAGSLQERGDAPGHTIESSPYTQITLHPIRTGAVVAGASITAAALWRASQNGLGQRLKARSR